MAKQDDDEIRQTDAVHPAILQVTGDETRRWCAAVWSVGPGEQQLVGRIRGLVESTLAAHWMQPPVQYEPGTDFVNSFDLVVYESTVDGLDARLRADGWDQVDTSRMIAEEYEQFDVLADEARKQGLSVATSPEELWRIPVAPRAEAVDIDHIEFGERIAEMMGDQVWGETPGWFSRAYCEELGERIGVEFTPDEDGLRRLDEALFGFSSDGIHWLEPPSFQAACDFLGVVVDAETDLDVQWGTCPVDEETGLAPLPLFRMRVRGRDWETIPVGRDVLQGGCVPWETDQKRQTTDGVLTALFSAYRSRFGS